MGLRDGFSDNKLLDDFGCGEIQPNRSIFSDEIGTIVANNSTCRDRPSLKTFDAAYICSQDGQPGRSTPTI
uniref:Uncharacterized protein n=2 Tax=Oryza sativa subsp. japonica TaxID=39947 RepID=Q2R584_ORYSJ|nr:hypothetical protein LOC_Os11g25890 [Oryza sativa Japonica Group]ABA93304.1 hypothetical protein LOC_Os11g25890 [Oryza sativa Japonica Group]